MASSSAQKQPDIPGSVLWALGELEDPPNRDYQAWVAHHIDMRRWKIKFTSVLKHGRKGGYLRPGSDPLRQGHVHAPGGKLGKVPAWRREPELRRKLSCPYPPYLADAKGYELRFERLV
eukprot:gene1744-33154_t